MSITGLPVGGTAPRIVGLAPVPPYSHHRGESARQLAFGWPAGRARMSVKPVAVRPRTASRRAIQPESRLERQSRPRVTAVPLRWRQPPERLQRAAMLIKMATGTRQEGVEVVNLTEANPRGADPADKQRDPARLVAPGFLSVPTWVRKARTVARW